MFYPLRHAAVVVAAVVVAVLPSVCASAEVRFASLPPGAVLPSAAVDHRGTLHVAYVLSQNVVYARSSDGGRHFEPSIRVNHRGEFAQAGQFRGPEIALGADDRVHIVWYNRAWQLGLPRSSQGVMYSVTGPDGRFLPERNLSNGPADGFSVAARERRVALLWHTDDALLVALSSDAGRSFSVSRLPDGLPCECCDTALQLAPAGGFQYVYRDRRQNRRDMYWVDRRATSEVTRARLDADSWLLEACPVSGASLEFASAGSTAAWERDGQLLMARQLPNGSWTRPQQVGAGKFPALAQAAERVLLVYKQGREIHWSLRDHATLREAEHGSRFVSRSDRPAAVALGGDQFLILP